MSALQEGLYWNIKDQLVRDLLPGGWGGGGGGGWGGVQGESIWPASWGT